MDLKISDVNIKEAGTYDREPQYNVQEVTKLVATSPSYTDPLIIVDGINRINIVQKAESTYLIHYQGYVSGYALVTDDGIREFGENYLSDERGIPDWYIIDTDDDPDATQWWVPDSYTPDQTIDCDRCTTAASLPELVTPGRTDGEVINWFCSDCWDDVRNQWSPERAHAGRRDVYRAEYLDQTVGDNPETADIGELAELAQSDDEKAQMHALTALGRVIPERIEKVVSIQPILTDQLESDVLLTRFGALSCLAMIAEHDPESALPVVDDVIPLLNLSSDGGILEEGIRFVAAVAEEYPFAVRESASNLVGLLQEDPPEKQKLVQALVEIAKSEPEAVISEVPELITYISNEDAEQRVGAIAVLGYVTKETPEATEMTIPMMSDLLEVSADRVRANAAGVFADLSEAYPEKFLSDLDPIINLVGDNNEYAQQNATYVLAQIAEQYPREVEPATSVLIDSLEADSENTRISACQALGYAGATSAVEPLEERRDEDPSMDVQQVAGWALTQISE